MAPFSPPPPPGIISSPIAMHIFFHRTNFPEHCTAHCMAVHSRMPQYLELWSIKFRMILLAFMKSLPRHVPAFGLRFALIAIVSASCFVCMENNANPVHGI
jgi:hypothetical protein